MSFGNQVLTGSTHLFICVIGTTKQLTHVFCLIMCGYLNAIRIHVLHQLISCIRNMLRELNTCNVNILKLIYNSDCSRTQGWPKHNPIKANQRRAARKDKDEECLKIILLLSLNRKYSDQ